LLIFEFGAVRRYVEPFDFVFFSSGGPNFSRKTSMDEIPIRKRIILTTKYF